MRFILCAAIIFVSAFASESSPYGFILAVMLLGFMFVILVTLVGLLTKIFGQSNRSIALIVAGLSPFIAMSIYFISFGRYLNSGTMFLRAYPLVENGYVTGFGKIFVIFYTFVLVATLVIEKTGNKNG